MESGVAEKHIGYGGVETDTDTETDSESRPTIVDEIRSVIRYLRGLQGVKGGGFIDAVLRGLGQVVFQNNALSGLLVLLAISVNSFVYAGAALFGAVVSTYTAMLLRIDNKLVRDGLFGFNGALTAIAMVAFTSREVAHGDLPSASLILYIVLAAGFSTILARAFAFMIRNDRVPGLNFPYCVATLLLLGAAAPVQRSRRWNCGPSVAVALCHRHAGLCQRYLAVWDRHGNLSDIPAGQLADRHRGGRGNRREFSDCRSSRCCRFGRRRGGRLFPWCE